MANLLERWLSRRIGKHRETKAVPDTTSAMLRGLIPQCLNCKGPLDGHAYRFFASHPSTPLQTSAAFLDAIYQENWVEVQKRQLPSLDKSLFVLYAIACPWGKAGSGMIAILLQATDPVGHELFHQGNLGPHPMSNLREACVTCKWIEFNSL
jgi:hypothetical protein